MKDSLFWEFNNDVGSMPSVIVGTIHLASEGALLHWDAIKHLIDQYGSVFTESSLEDSSQEVIHKYVFYKESDRHLKYITPNRWNKMQEIFLKYFSVDLNRMRDMRPLFILSAIYQSLVQSKGKPLDYRIWDYALEQGKNVQGIESTEEQLQIMLGLSEELQYRQLIKLSKHVSKTKLKFRKILKAYEEQQISVLYKLSKGSMGLDKSALLSNRNEIMVDRLIGQHHKEASFFCFGAGHLGGKNGVITLLKKQGMIVKPILH